ncbi:hypothetical protein HQN60_10865 [Deefgea piscis]|uniref:Uncharacterized protein n=1 Tax=Deefgea piscis TaxID=2739061 RepID=A0A6M8SX29_9NEIS|nr:hypothetical protein [Deefgea piscis]QKJ67159.1 hypothetical protein HQN60_10865 [Deefgea piscis]
MVELPLGGSAAHNPDLAWDQVRETILMMGIAVAQVRHAMEEGSASFTTLADSFAVTCQHIESLRNDLTQILPTLPAELDLPNKISEINAQNMQSIIAFQFYDRLSQRLEHVCSTISELAVLVSDHALPHQAHAWLDLQRKIRSQYTMEQEKVLFDAILHGDPIHTALIKAGNISINFDPKPRPADDGGVELF